MAEFALGLTKTAVEGTLIRVKSAIEEEAKLKVRVQNDLLFITGEFEMMQSFLKVANKERAKNEVVQTWVRQLRDLAFDVEDCVEFVVHLDNKSAWNWFWRVVPSCLAQPLPMDVAVADIQQLKARVEDVSRRNTRYNLVTNTDSGSSKSTKTVKALEKRATGSASSSAFHILTKVWEALGKQRGLDDLKNLITSEGSDLQVVSVWGSTEAADHGKSSIFRKVFSDPEICHEFKNRAWVELTTHPFSPDEFLRSLRIQFRPSSSQQAKFDPDTLTAAGLMEQLKEQRYLIILEQVSSVVEWNALRMCLPDSNNGSRIMVSTKDLGVALLCTGELYQVSELTHFSYGQSLCAFHKKGSVCRSDIGDFHWQLRRRRHGVISVWGPSSSKSVLYKGMIQKCIETEFEQHIWLDIIGYFKLTFFAISLLMRCYPQYEQEAEAVYAMEMVEVVQKCCKFLREHDCLIVINGLRSTAEWDLIKDAFLSEPIKSNIVVFTNEGKVAEHCADEYRMLSIRDALTPPARLTKGGQYYGKGLMPESSLERQSRVFTKRREEAVAWCNDYSRPRRPNDEFKLRKSLAYPGVISVWGIPGIGKSDLVRTIYYDLMTSAAENEIFHSNGTEGEFSRLELSYSWVDVPCPFNLIEFSQHLLLDFYSDNLKAMEAAAVAMMDGQDPVQWCSKFLLEDQCLVVINGLQSTRDWELIKDTFLSGATTSCIIVITNEQSVATHCVDRENQVLNIKSLEADEALQQFTKIAWSWNERALTPTELELSKVTISKCGGIPKVIAAIGEYCRASTMTSLGCLNSDFIGILEADIRFNSLRGLFSWMHLKFDASSDSIKRCIFYLPVFPIDHKIRRRRLLRRWIAEGYSRDTFAGTTAEENGEMLFSKLVDLGVIQMWRPRSGSEDEEGMCQVNGFFHGYIISRTMSEDNLVCALDGCCSLNSQRTGRHVSIFESWERDILVFESIDLSRLRSLTVFGRLVLRYLLLPTRGD